MTGGHTAFERPPTDKRCFDRRQLADAVGIAADDVRRWSVLRLIRDPPDGLYDLEDLERARLIKFVAERAIGVEQLAELNAAQGDLLGRFLDLAGVAGGIGQPLEDAAAKAGLDPQAASRLWTASGLTYQEEAFEEDLQLLETAASALHLGLPEDALLQLVRVYADALERVAEAESRLFHLHVHEQLRQLGLDGLDLIEATRSLSDSLTDLIDPTILYFHRKAWVRAIREDLLLHLREDAAAPGGAVDELQIAVLFVDLASFTPFTESVGDAVAAGVLGRFSDLVRASAAAHHGQVIKQIGDEFMIVLDSARNAVRCGLDISEQTRRDREFLGVRAGAHTGTAVYREADYLGATVNLAARVTAEAQRDQLLVTEAVRDGAEDLGDVEFRPLGGRQLKGISSAVALFEASDARWASAGGS